MPLYGRSTRAGVPIAYDFTLAGSLMSWGTSNLTDMSDVTMKAEPFEGRLSVSELRCSFSDNNGSIWNYLGHGTTWLGTTFSATVYIGGTMDYSGRGPYDNSATPSTELWLGRTNTGNSATVVIHKGKVTEVSRKNRIVTITSKNAMSQLADLEWRFPIGTTQYAYDTKIGSVFFYSENIATLGSEALFKQGDNGKTFHLYGFWGSSQGIGAAYPTVAGRGTLGVGTGFYFPGTQFYYDYGRYLFNGSWLENYRGTVESLELAYSLGFQNLSESEAARSSDSFGSKYTINKTRLYVDGGEPTNANGSHLNFQQGRFYLESTPATLWREMITGHAVTHLFGSADIEPVTWATAVLNTAYQTYKSEIDPKGGAVLPYLKEIITPIQALFSIDVQNLFRLHTFGPRNFSEVIGTFGGNTIIDSEVSVSEDDKFNRVVLDYGYSLDNGSFSRRVERKGTNWSQNSDYPFTLESKWIYNDNDAAITADRILNRFYNPLARMMLEVPLDQVSSDIGSLFDIEDTDLGFSGRVFEIIGWKKNFTNKRTIALELIDADALYKIKGYAKFEGDNDMTLLVSGTSTSGWGTNGTVANINSAFYGSAFSFF